jgi:hypothetical protein
MADRNSDGASSSALPFIPTVSSMFQAVKQMRKNKANEGETSDLLAPNKQQIEELAPISVPHAIAYSYSDDEVEMPKQVSELVDEILLYTFSFLPYQDLLHVEQTCTRWRKLASDEVLWKREYLRVSGKNVETTEYRKLFFERFYRIGFIRDVRKKVAITSTLQTSAIIIYGFIAPLAYLIAGIVLCVDIPLMADGMITNVTYISIPIVIMLFAFLVTALGLLIDPGYINRTKSRLFDILVAQKQIPDAQNDNNFINFQGSYTLDRKLDEGWTMAINLIIWPFVLVPLIGMSFLARNTLTYTQCLWPVYLYCGLYVLLPISFAFIKFKTLLTYTSDNIRLLIFVGIFGNLFNLFVFLQMLLIGLKLDGIITQGYVVACVPTWMLLAICLCFCQFMNGFTSTLGAAKDSINTAVCCIQPLLYPIVPFGILLILRVDRYVNMSYVDVFIPVYITLGFMMCCLLCIVGTCCIPFRIFFNSVSLERLNAEIVEEEQPTQAAGDADTAIDVGDDANDGNG